MRPTRNGLVNKIGVSMQHGLSILQNDACLKNVLQRNRRSGGGKNMLNFTTLLIIVLCVLCYGLWLHCSILKREVFEWRKRWIIERFGVGVEGNEGDYFVTPQYTSDLKCLMFNKKAKSLAVHGAPVRKWGDFFRSDLISYNRLLPIEEDLGLPKNPDRDNRGWISVGLGLCPLPPALHEAAIKKQQTVEITMS